MVYWWYLCRVSMLPIHISFRAEARVLVIGGQWVYLGQEQLILTVNQR